MTSRSYVLITPAYNEEKFIEKTIKAVFSQTIKPLKWIIVSDGSTDGTDKVVESYSDGIGFLKFVQIPRKEERNFASKVSAIREGYKRLYQLKFEYIGNLDADISFDDCYYEKIIDKFTQNEKLGIAGGDRFDVYGNKYEKIKRSRNSVMGAVQLFRRKCYEDIRGYRPLKYGGIDAVAEITARMYGWEVQSFSELSVYHYRRTGTARSGVLAAKFREGRNDYIIGYHPLFELLRCIYRSFSKPYMVPGIFWFSGYILAYLRVDKKQVSRELIKYIRSEQLERLRSAVTLKRKKVQIK